MHRKNFTFISNSKPNSYLSRREQADSVMLLHSHKHSHYSNTLILCDEMCFQFVGRQINLLL
jgi:hypothetical protein